MKRISKANQNLNQITPSEFPSDLFIPPNALEICLETFTGPLDLLGYLIKKQNIDILDLEIAKITDQYIEYIDLMESLNFELAAEYLVMAATLAEIKSKMLLPPIENDDETEEDPRVALIERLKQYKIKNDVKLYEIDIIKKHVRSNIKVNNHPQKQKS